MQESANRRVGTIGAHFNLSRKSSATKLRPSKPDSVSFDVLALQKLLEHDNWETRRKLKDLMNSDLFVP